jgi:penicillin G amidase
MKKWFLIIVFVIAGILVVGIGSGYLWFQHIVKRSLPAVSGEISMIGITEKVEIIRDTYGVPHIYARNETDLFFGFGYAVAQDRLWQMDFFRRLGQGHLSELFGKDLVQTDRYFRLLTAPGMRKYLPPALEPAFKAFASGINAYITSHSDRLPIEFTLLRYKPEKWKKDDYLDIAKVANWGLACGFATDLTAGKILKKVGEEKFREAFPAWPNDGPIIVPKGYEGVSASANQALRVAEKVRGLIGLPVGAASNNWVISGKKAQNGKPMLANDTHLDLTNPSFWWEVNLNCPTIHVSGFAVPGVPSILIGHNRDVAWGLTNVMVDDVDFYIEKINPKNPHQYWYKDHWEDMKLIEETIKVKGSPPVTKEILLTRHGPVVAQEGKEGAKETISQRWAFTEGLQAGKAIHKLMTAGNAREVIEALRYWELPSQNVVFADRAGNIGYWCCATIPIRPKGDTGILPVPGWTGEYEWKGYVPFDQRPHMLNPEQGFIATSNNKVTNDDYPYVVGNYWEPMDRVTRVTQLLKSKEKLTVDDFKRIQHDTYCVLASELTPKFIEVLKRHAETKGFQQTREILAGWDFVMAKESAAACIYEMTFRKMMDNIFRDELGEKLFRKYLKTTMFPPRAIRALVRKGSSPWFDNVDTPGKETMEDIMQKSLDQALSELREKMGDDMDKWAWGKIHTLTFEHPLGKKKPLDRLFNLGPFPVPGNHLTVNKKQYSYDKPYHAEHGVSQRMIVDLANIKSALHVLPTGESGQLKSPHYRDQIPLYLGNGYHPAWPDRAQVEKNKEGILTLKPAGK